MASFNSVTLVGNLTRPISMKSTHGGMTIAETGIAVNEKHKDKESVLFLDLTFFGKVAEIAEKYLEKGSSVLVSGRLKYDSWEAKDGTKRNKVSMVVDKMQMLGGRSDRPSDVTEPEDINQDEIPF